MNKTYSSILDEEVVIRAIAADMKTAKAIAYHGAKKCREFDIIPFNVKEMLTNLFSDIVYEGVTPLPWKGFDKKMYHRAYLGEWTLYYSQSHLDLVYVVSKQFNGYSKVLYSPKGHEARRFTEIDFEIKECKSTDELFD